jgi:hypothetical protein
MIEHTSNATGSNKMNHNPAEGPDHLTTAERYDAAARQLRANLTWGVGQHLIHTDRRQCQTIVEFRGFHNHAETGKRMARVIFRPVAGPPFENSVDPAELRA